LIKSIDQSRRPDLIVRRDGDRARPWLLAQRWEHLLFAHWRADPDAVRRLLPRGVEPDVRAGEAWVAIVAFVMAATRPSAVSQLCLPPIPELNVRTYVRLDDVPGVWFLSLDASSPVFVTIGTALYGLRYHRARMTALADGERVHYLSTRGGASFAASYRPTGPPSTAGPGSLEHFLVERYRLFAQRRGRLVTAEVAHAPWRLQPADAHIELNRMAPPGLGLDDEPLLHFSRSVDARISAPWPVRARSQRGSDPVRGLTLRFRSRRRLARQGETRVAVVTPLSKSSGVV
jgi:uncharacterized protein YqjF (DUF2071 family)